MISKETALIYRLVYLSKKRWYFYVVSPILLMVLGMVVTQRKAPVFFYEGSILVNTPVESSTLMKEDQLFLTPLEVENAVAVLKSSTIVKEIVDSLQLHVKVSSIVGKDDFISLKVLNSTAGLQGMNLIVGHKDANQFSLYDESHELIGDYNYNELFDYQGSGLSIQKTRKWKSEPFEYNIEFKSKQETINKLLNSLTVDPTGKRANVLKVGFKYSNSDLGAVILDAIMAGYINYESEKKRLKAVSALKSIEEQLKELKSILTLQEDSIEGYKIDNTIIDLEHQSRLAYDKTKDVEGQIRRQELVLDALDVLETEFAQAEQMELIVSPESIGIGQDNLNKVVNQINGLKTKLAGFSGSISETNPIYLDIVNDIERLKGSFHQNVGLLRQNINSKKDDLIKILSNEQETLDSNPKVKRALKKLTENYQVNLKLYNYLKQRKSDVAVSIANNSIPIEIVDTAYPVNNKSRIDILIIGAAFALGLFLPLAIFFILDQFSDKIRYKWQVNEIGFPVFSKIVTFSGKGSKKARTRFHQNIGLLGLQLEKMQQDTNTALTCLFASYQTYTQLPSVVDGLAQFLTDRGLKTLVCQVGVAKDVDSPNSVPYAQQSFNSITHDEIMELKNSKEYDVMIFACQPIQTSIDFYTLKDHVDHSAITIELDRTPEEIIETFSAFDPKFLSLVVMHRHGQWF